MAMQFGITSRSIGYNGGCGKTKGPSGPTVDRKGDTAQGTNYPDNNEPVSSF